MLALPHMLFGSGPPRILMKNLSKGSDSTVPFKNTSKNDDEGCQRDKRFLSGLC